MWTSDFHYDLPEELIAQQPAPERDASRLLVLNRADASIRHQTFRDLPEFLRRGDVLVFNDSRVIPARLRAVQPRTASELEVLLLEERGLNDWWTMMRPGKRARLGTEIQFLHCDGKPGLIFAKVTEVNAEGHRRLHFTGVANIAHQLEQLGEVPLPPYIRRPATGPSADDAARYQTVFARAGGSVAAPTAGLHFTERSLEQLREAGVVLCRVTLHVGPGTFAPVKAEEIEDHVMHEERFEVSESAAWTINAAKADGRRVIAVGTTSLRVLESVAAAKSGRVVAGTGRTRIFIYPPFQFRIVDALLTNFHLPCSTLLMLVSAFAAPGAATGRDVVLRTYAEAARQRYRFFSYGDAMLIL